MAIAKMTKDFLDLLVKKNLLAEEAIELIFNDADFATPEVMYQGGVVEYIEEEYDEYDDDGATAFIAAGPCRKTLEEARRDALASWLIVVAEGDGGLLARGISLPRHPDSARAELMLSINRAVEFARDSEKAVSSNFSEFPGLCEELRDIFPDLQIEVVCVYPDGTGVTKGGFKKKRLQEMATNLRMKLFPSTTRSRTNPHGEIL